MGTDKALIRGTSGNTFLEIAHDRLTAVVDEVRVSVAAKVPATQTSQQADDIRDAYRCIYDSDQYQSIGPMAGLNASLQAAEQDGYDGILITPVDTPNLTVDDLSMLIKHFDNQRPEIVCATTVDSTAESNEAIRFEPLIAIYPTASQTLIDECILRGKFGLQRFLRRQNVESVALSADHCQNMNTPQDLSP